MTTIPWKCPRCDAGPNTRGKGGRDACDELSGSGRYTRECQGFLCLCEESTSESHGDTLDDPCPNAVCHHCGWSSSFPVGPFNPAKLKGWAKTAWSEGWRPPQGWVPACKK